ncbi:hypothetical protein [Bdellovibrio sp. BCCA]|uniref:hypothetical protein n=1 Tax=Bdellovibrio sp. BCCA TaxID=3136281 RepID=UPI0030F3398C
MKKVNPTKSRKIQKLRGYLIEEVVIEGVLLDVRENPSYPEQYIEVYYFKDYVWAVISGSNPDRYITMYRSRKLKKEYGL